MFKSDGSFYTDATPDYNIESIVYLAKCQLLLDYYQIDTLIRPQDEEQDESNTNNQETPIDFEGLHKKLTKCKETLQSRLLKWKLHETNRHSFLFNVVEIEKLKVDKESLRLRSCLELCNECLVYICYKLNRVEECVWTNELTGYLLNASTSDLIENKLLDVNSDEPSLLSVRRAFLLLF